LWGAQNTGGDFFGKDNFQDRREICRNLRWLWSGGFGQTSQFGDGISAEIEVDPFVSPFPPEPGQLAFCILPRGLCNGRFALSKRELTRKKALDLAEPKHLPRGRSEVANASNFLNHTLREHRIRPGSNAGVEGIP
jgi:hypothetical protein